MALTEYQNKLLLGQTALIRTAGAVFTAASILVLPAAMLGCDSDRLGESAYGEDDDADSVYGDSGLEYDTNTDDALTTEDDDISTDAYDDSAAG
ncbi:MAG: hypothetical protein AAGF47_01310 [Planctomycetota bacterium]